jgi:hypothetical protein
MNKEKFQAIIDAGLTNDKFYVGSWDKCFIGSYVKKNPEDNLRLVIDGDFGGADSKKAQHIANDLGIPYQDAYDLFADYETNQRDKLAAKLQDYLNAHS